MKTPLGWCFAFLISIQLDLPGFKLTSGEGGWWKGFMIEFKVPECFQDLKTEINEKGFHLCRKIPFPT
jgi:hypothetical protein